MNKPNIYHVDVFATQPLTGNGLTVFLDTAEWSVSRMQNLTREMKQFESIFLSDVSSRGATARVFTAEEELPFAGHPVLGAAVVLHRTQTPEANEGFWVLNLPIGEVTVSTRKMTGYYIAEMNQGIAQWGVTLNDEQMKPFLERISLTAEDMPDGLCAQVISTGLPYLIVPVTSEGLAKTKIQGTDLEATLTRVGAKFLLVLDVKNREIRTWDNLGKVEDIATGSAAGPAASYLFRNNFADSNAVLKISQGRFEDRASEISVHLDPYDALLVSGEVWPVARGLLEQGSVEILV
jgi:trans-2,3-dihydro-3-hydroxyanthranilate isomerase